MSPFVATIAIDGNAVPSCSVLTLMRMPRRWQGATTVDSSFVCRPLSTDMSTDYRTSLQTSNTGRNTANSTSVESSEDFRVACRGRWPRCRQAAGTRWQASAAHREAQPDWARDQLPQQRRCGTSRLHVLSYHKHIFTYDGTCSRCSLRRNVVTV